MAGRRTLALLFAPREHALSHLSQQNHAKCLGGADAALLPTFFNSGGIKK